MKTVAAVVLSSILSLALAQPHAHRHAHRRDAAHVVVVNEEVVVTDIVIKTVMLNPGEKAPLQTTFASVVSQPSVPAPSAPAPSSSDLPVPSNPVPVSSPAPVSIPAPVSSPAPVSEPSTTSTTTSTSVYTPPPVSSSTFTPAPAPSSTPSAAPAPASSAAAPASPVGGTGAGPTGSPVEGASLPSGCSSSASCIGHITFYDATSGPELSCAPETLPENYVALAEQMMGTLSNSGVGQPTNPLCGKTIQITNPATGSSATGTLVDRCGGCPNGTSLDLSPSLFSQLASQSEGNVGGIEWFFTD
ncbi:hypothetical protein MMC20_001285 [Loxospora ochrophaea]|nr:hypothetical protein [Loxospora ochrophaea]